MRRTKLLLVICAMVLLFFHALSRSPDARKGRPVSKLSVVSGAFAQSGPSLLEQTALSMAPGSWAELNTIGLEPLIYSVDAGGIPRSLFEFADGGVWYPATEQFFFIGSGHLAPKRFARYTAQTNNWEQLQDPYWFPPSLLTTLHGFDHNAINVAGGEIFHHPFQTGNRIVYRYNIAQDSWSALPAIPENVVPYVECCRGIEYFPERGGLVVVTGGEVYFYDDAPAEWSLLASGLPMGGYENFAEYSPAYELLIFGGGLGNRNIHMMDAQGTLSQLNNAPTPLGITFAVVTSDPVTGNFLVLADALRLYEFDALADEWQILDNNPPIPTEEGNAYDVIAAPISNFGVTMFVSSYNFNESGSVWLYKNAAGDTTAPAVTVTAPAPGDTVLGTIVVSASATDEVGVAGVQFLLDGADFGNEDVAPPYELTWETFAAANGPHTLTARARDTAGNSATSNPVQVTVDNPVNTPPDATDDVASTDEDTPLTIDVLANDEDPDGDALSIVSATSGANGTVTVNPDSTLTYDPASDFFGADQSIYVISDGRGGLDTATVLLTIASVNDPPVAAAQAVTVDQDNSVPLVLSATDVESDPLVFSIVSPPAAGTLSPLTGPDVTYTPDIGYNGPDSFEFVANDGTDDSNIAAVSITVLPVATGPLVATGLATGVSSANWTPVSTGRAFGAMVVICSPAYDDTAPPMVARVRLTGSTTFDVRVDRADGAATPVTGVDVYWFAVEEGVYTQAVNGVTMEVVTYTSTVTDRRGSWQGEVRAYANQYTAPVVLGQVMSYNDPAFSVFWARGAARGAPPSATTLRVGKHVAEDPNQNRQDETVGYIVIESGGGTFETIDYLAAVGGDNIRGVGNAPPYAYAISGMAAVTGGVVNTAGMDGGNGGWPIPYGTDAFTSVALQLAYDEDQLADNERNHTTEQVAYLVFGTQAAQPAVQGFAGTSDRLDEADAARSRPKFQSIDEHQPQDFGLGQNYPNPFNASTIIEFALPQNARIDLRLYDLRGQEISVLRQGHHRSGTHRILLDATTLAGGVYIYRLRVADRIYTRKLILLR